MEDPLHSIKALNTQIAITLDCMSILESQIDELRLLAIYRQKQGQSEVVEQAVAQIKSKTGMLELIEVQHSFLLSLNVKVSEGLIDPNDLMSFVEQTTEALNKKVSLEELMAQDVATDDTMGQYIQRSELYSDITEQDVIDFEVMLK